MILLDSREIKHHLATHLFDVPPYIHLFSSINSTNQFLKELPKTDYLDICCAETQTNGRGRFGRDWFSPLKENIYCSSRWYFKPECTHLPALGLVVALAVAATLNELNMVKDIKIKWPNDLLWQGKKLCGILIEMTKEKNGAFAVVIGVGLNVNSVTQNHPENKKIKRPWCSLYEITGRQFDRNLLIAKFIIQLHRHISLFITEGFIEFLPTWQALDYLYGKPISVFQPNSTLCGVAKGVTLGGLLILEDDKFTTHFISSGVASLSEGF